MSNESHQHQKQGIATLLKFENHHAKIEHEAYLLGFQFISEINKNRELRGWTLETLAEEADIPADYLTAVFQGEMPLDLASVATLQRALNLSFSIVAQSTTTMQMDKR